MRAENLGRRPAPYGAGMHPYVRAELGGIDTSVLRVPAETWMDADQRQIPTGRSSGSVTVGSPTTAARRNTAQMEAALRQ